jgi:dienelactone hydrolase
MMTMTRKVRNGVIAVLAPWLLSSGGLGAQATPPATAVTTDGVTIYGEQYFGSLPEASPLILLFHQGGSNGRGEYADLASWLNGEGFRAIAWDQRSGGDRYGRSNRTADGLSATVSTEYCDAHADLQAALDYVKAHDLADRVVAWGSSYSGALVFRLAAENPTEIAGVVAFSPAAGGPMVDCPAHVWVESISVPIAVFRPASEMDLPAAMEQRDVLSAAGVEFAVVEDGVHGSSMLVDARTGHDMGAARRSIVDWLHRLYPNGG